MSELRQFHPSLRVSKVQELKNNRFLVIGDTPRDVAILQSDDKMKACLGQNVSASLPKAYQTAKTASKTLVVKGVPTEVSEKDFKEFLDLNKIIYAKAERLTSKKDGRVLQMFKLEIKDEAEAEALISQNLTCHTTGIIYKVEEFRSPVSVQQCWNCQSFGHSAKTCRSKTKCVICGESHHHKGCPNREKKQPKCDNCKGPHVASYKGCPAYKKQAFRQHVVDNQKSYAAILRQNTAPPQPQDKTFTFSAEQLVKFVANVAIQVAQPQVCYINSPQDAIDKKSSMCRRVSEAAKTHLGVDIADDDLLHNTLKDSLSNIDTNITTQNELEELAVTLCDKLMKAIDTSTPKVYSRNDPKSPISQAILDLIKEKRRLRRLYNNTQDPNIKSTINKLQKEIKTKINQESTISWEKFCNSISLESDPKKSWRKITNFLKPKGPRSYPTLKLGNKTAKTNPEKAQLFVENFGIESHLFSKSQFDCINKFVEAHSYHFTPLNSLYDNITDTDDDSNLVADVDPDTLIRIVRTELKNGKGSRYR